MIEIAEPFNSRINACSESAAAYLLARTFAPAENSVLLVCADAKTAEIFISDLKFFLSSQFPVRSFLGWEVLPFDSLSPALELSAERLLTLTSLVAGERLVVVSTVDALVQKIVTPEVLTQMSFSLKTGEALDRDSFLQKLVSLGYFRGTLVEECGQFAVRGAVVDLFPPGEAYPVRLEFFGDVIESIRSFDPGTQRSRMEKNTLSIIPVREFLLPSDQRMEALQFLKVRARELEIPDRFIEPIQEAINTGVVLPGMEHLLPILSGSSSSLWSYLLEKTPVVVWNEHAVFEASEAFELIVKERAEKLKREGQLVPPEEQCYESSEWLQNKLSSHVSHIINPKQSLFTVPKAKLQYAVELEKDSKTETIPEILPNDELSHRLLVEKHGKLPFKPLAEEIQKSLSAGIFVGIVISHASRVRRLSELLRSYGIETVDFPGNFKEWYDEAAGRGRVPSGVALLHGDLSTGIKAPQENFHLIDDTEIFPEISKTRRARQTSNVRRILSSVSQLKENDHVVHIDHGIGLYRGLKHIAVGDHVGDFLLLEYAEEAKLFVPVENIGKVQKYIGAEGQKPALARLGNPAWSKAKRKVEEAVSELAGQLINLYAQREISIGESFGDIDEDDHRFADTFPFEETPDQQRAIEEVLNDMKQAKPMDRLVCGDVGYGKTEVALRAAFKAVNRGKQVAVLVPTTILADQHYKNFKERFAEYPFRVGAVSRFFSTAENKKTLQELAAGKIDIVIGTHRLLQKDVFFKTLGLLIIDEEHRFGVAHKEKLKRLKSDVEVLTLTATPIPRTLHMSLLGIRDLSIIETPPVDRHVIKTYVTPYQPDTVREAILREIGRGGQVFYIHNRVESIEMVSKEVQDLVPEARVSFAHGQMKEGELESIMHRFIQGAIDVLVSTTIVESGLDISNANTMIIRKAEMFGLAELYQLRGRVGRSSRRAYAYLFVGDPLKLGVEARKRLEVLQSLDDLGMGFRLAIQDMEIRGAGNLLGKDQSGDVNLVGFEMYSRILKSAIREAKLREQKDDQLLLMLRPQVDPELSLGFNAYIPSFYIPDVEERLILYQRLVDLRNRAQGMELAEEIYDRFGKPPQEVETLIEVMILKSLLRDALVISAVTRGEVLYLSFHPESRLNVQRFLTLIEKSSGNIRLSPDMVLSLRLTEQHKESPLEIFNFLKEVFSEIGAFSNEKTSNEVLEVAQEMR